MTSDWPAPENIADFSYSKKSHFRLFSGLPFHSYNAGDPDPVTCDVKVYQDYLVYCFIRQNVPAGSRILEVGGGESRVLKFFSENYECWNADKCEGLGNGPMTFSSPHYRIVYDYVGDFSPNLPPNYFDFVFSISALEHTPENPTVHQNVLADINRVLKPGCPTLHCFDAILGGRNKTWINGLIPFIHSHQKLSTHLLPTNQIWADPDLYYMTRRAYEASWEEFTKIPYEWFGRAFSLNLFWTKPR
jgi:SAM-dependent methyltransferase